VSQSPVYAIADQYVERVAALDPIAATGMGLPGHEHELTDYSPAGEAARAAHTSETLAALAAAPITSDDDRVAREVMAERLHLDRELHDAGEQYRSLNILFSPMQVLRQVFDLMPHATEEDWDNIAARMHALPAALGRYQQTLEQGMERGLTASRRQAEQCAQQAAVWSGQQPGQTGFFELLLDGYDGPSPGLRGELAAGAQQAQAAYAEFGAFLRDRYVPAAEPRDAAGRDRYSLAVRVFNGIALDLDETYRWGWDELHRIEAEMAATAQRIQPGANAGQAIAALELDATRTIDGVEPFRVWMQELQNRTVAELDGRHFDIPEPVRHLEAMIAPAGGALAMYYTGPAEDFSRPGRTWYPTGGKTRFPLWREVSIAYHEGVPGHHLQIAFATYQRERLSRFQRLLATTSGYAEGWALYAERLMAELGYLEDPGAYMGMLAGQALRAARVVVDIGLHLELALPEGERFHPGATWSPELAHQFMIERSHFPADFLQSEVTRYLGLPAQAISYKAGERVWLDTRAAAEMAARRGGGAAFDLKAFHMRALALGPMGLEQMRRELGG